MATDLLYVRHLYASREAPFLLLTFTRAFASVPLLPQSRFRCAPSVVQRAVFRYDSAPLADTAATYIYSTRNSNPAQKCQRHVSSGRNRVPTPFPDMLLTLRQTSRRPLGLSMAEGPPLLLTLSAASGQPGRSRRAPRHSRENGNPVPPAGRLKCHSEHSRGI